MLLFDAHPGVYWASEAVKIPYFNPFTRRTTLYIPDFFVAYTDKNNHEHKELIEIKPQREVPGYSGRVSKLIESRQTLNMLKWKAAVEFCARRHWLFRVATEADLFRFNGAMKK